jgi:hypothetical protein
MQDDLAEAFFAVPHTVLRRRLKPLTLRHCFVLSVAENAIVSGDQTPTIGDLYQAVEVCSRPDKFFYSKDANTLLRWWHQRRTRNADYPAELEKFAAYLADYSASPKIWSKGESKGKSGGNWIMTTVAGVMRSLGMGSEQAWSLSPGEAAWYLAAAMESDPMVSISIMSEEEEEALEAINRLN